MTKTKKLVTFKRSEEGYAVSHCDRFFIDPVYAGRTTPIEFKLVDTKLSHVDRADTQKRLKEIANDRVVDEQKKAAERRRVASLTDAERLAELRAFVEAERAGCMGTVKTLISGPTADMLNNYATAYRTVIEKIDALTPKEV